MEGHIIPGKIHLFQLNSTVSDLRPKQCLFDFCGRSDCRLPVDDIDGTDAVAASAIGACFFIDNMHIPLFTDRINRTNFSASTTVDTAFVDPMSSHFSPLSVDVFKLSVLVEI